jgi:hypothetical protein
VQHVPVRVAAESKHKLWFVQTTQLLSVIEGRCWSQSIQGATFVAQITSLIAGNILFLGSWSTPKLLTRTPYCCL